MSGFFSNIAQAETSYVPSSEEIEIKSDTGFNVGIEWFDERNCKGRKGNAFYFKVGNQELSIPKEKMAVGMLRESRILKGDPKGNITAIIPRDSGCDSKPLPFAQVTVQPNKQDLPRWVIFSETQDNSRVAKYIQHLNKIGACKTTQFPKLIGCSGSKTSPIGEKVAITFFVVMISDTKPSPVPLSGIPIHARCEEFQGQVSCMVSEELDNKVTVKAGIETKDLDASAIVALREKIIAFANSIAVTRH